MCGAIVASIPTIRRRGTWTSPSLSHPGIRERRPGPSCNTGAPEISTVVSSSTLQKDFDSRQQPHHPQYWACQTNNRRRSQTVELIVADQSCASWVARTLMLDIRVHESQLGNLHRHCKAITCRPTWPTCRQHNYLMVTDMSKFSSFILRKDEFTDHMERWSTGWYLRLLYYVISSWNDLVLVERKEI